MLAVEKCIKLFSHKKLRINSFEDVSLRFYDNIYVDTRETISDVLDLF